MAKMDAEVMNATSAPESGKRKCITASAGILAEEIIDQEVVKIFELMENRSSTFSEDSFDDVGSARGDSSSHGVWGEDSCADIDYEGIVPRSGQHTQQARTINSASTGSARGCLGISDVLVGAPLGIAKNFLDVDSVTSCDPNFSSKKVCSFSHLQSVTKNEVDRSFPACSSTNYFVDIHEPKTEVPSSLRSVVSSGSKEYDSNETNAGSFSSEGHVSVATSGVQTRVTSNLTPPVVKIPFDGSNEDRTCAYEGIDIGLRSSPRVEYIEDIYVSSKQHDLSSGGYERRVPFFYDEEVPSIVGKTQLVSSSREPPSAASEKEHLDNGLAPSMTRAAKSSERSSESLCSRRCRSRLTLKARILASVALLLFVFLLILFTVLFAVRPESEAADSSLLIGKRGGSLTTGLPCPSERPTSHEESDAFGAIAQNESETKEPQEAATSISFTNHPTKSPDPSVIVREKGNQQSASIELKKRLTFLVGDKIKDQKTPHYRAFEWITEQDEFIGRQIRANSVPINAEQRFLLALLYFSTSGGTTEDGKETGWERYGRSAKNTNATCCGSDVDTAESWLSTIEECRWFGVKCSEKNLVEEIHLAQNNLSGSLPAELFLLPNLRSFSVERNSLSGEIPEELVSSLGRNGTLRTAKVHFNKFTGKVKGCDVDAVPVCGHHGPEPEYSFFADCAPTNLKGPPIVSCPCCTDCCDPVNESCMSVAWEENDRAGLNCT